jgi:hypothetical protein
VLVGLLVLLNGWGLRNYFEERPPPLDRVAAAIGAGLAPGDGIVFDRDGSARFGIAYYLGAPEVPGLDASRDGDGLIRDEETAARNRRIWVVLPEGATPAVVPGTGWTPALKQSFGAIQLLRFDRQG